MPKRSSLLSCQKVLSVVCQKLYFCCHANKRLFSYQNVSSAVMPKCICPVCCYAKKVQYVVIPKRSSMSSCQKGPVCHHTKCPVLDPDMMTKVILTQSKRRSDKMLSVVRLKWTLLLSCQNKHVCCQAKRGLYVVMPTWGSFLSYKKGLSSYRKGVIYCNAKRDQ